MFESMSPLRSFLLGYGAGKGAGGGGSGIIMKSGSFTLENNTAPLSITIKHNLGVVPQIVLINAPNFDEDITDVDVRKNKTFYGVYLNINSLVNESTPTVAAIYYASNGTLISRTLLTPDSAFITSFEGVLSPTISAGISYNNNLSYVAGTRYDWCVIAGIST